MCLVSVTPALNIFRSGTTESAASTMGIANAFNNTIFVYVSDKETNSACQMEYAPVRNGQFLAWKLESKGKVYVTVKTSFDKDAVPVAVNYPMNHDESLIVLNGFGKTGVFVSAAKGSVWIDPQGFDHNPNKKHYKTAEINESGPGSSTLHVANALDVPIYVMLNADKETNSDCGYSRVASWMVLLCNYKAPSYLTIKTSLNKDDLPIVVNHEMNMNCNFIVASDGKNAYFTTAAKDNIWIDEKGINHHFKEKCKKNEQ